MSNNPNALMTQEQLAIERFLNYVHKSDDLVGCWLWTSATNKDGYGQFSVAGRTVQAHRWGYEYFMGEIPGGLQVLHNCPDGDNPRCVNPEHLWLGTHAENMADMARKGRSIAQAHPEKMGRGETHWSHNQPEKRQRGEKNSAAKLTDFLVRDILRRYARGGVTQRELSRDYHVSRSNIGLIVTRKIWTHVEMDNE